jgi:hypothetical protein
MMANHTEALAFMDKHRGTVIKYDQYTLRHIKALADTDQLDILHEYIELRLEIANR